MKLEYLLGLGILAFALSKTSRASPVPHSTDLSSPTPSTTPVLEIPNVVADPILPVQNIVKEPEYNIDQLRNMQRLSERQESAEIKPISDLMRGIQQQVKTSWASGYGSGWTPERSYYYNMYKGQIEDIQEKYEPYQSSLEQQIRALR